MKSTSARLAVLALAAILASSVAFADDTVTDGDGIWGPTHTDLSALNLGNVCADSSANGTALIGLKRNGNYPGPQVFAKGQTATASVGSASSGLSAVMVAGHTGVTLPSTWNMASNNTLSSTAAKATVTLTTGSTLGAASGTVNFTVTGTGSNGGTLANTSPITVNWTVVSCGPSDTTGPVVTFSQSPDGSLDWFVTSPAVTRVTATDDSGIASLACTVDGNAATLTNVSSTATSRSADVSTTAQGLHTVVCTATDGSANANSGQGSDTLALDSIVPSITGSVTPASPTGSNGWYVTAPTVSFDCDDDESGLDSCDGPTILGESAIAQSVTGNASDVAGNTNSDTVSGLLVDLSDPTVVCGTSPTFILNAGGTVTAAVTDAISGAASPTASAAADTTSVGAKTVPVTGYDNAGRSATVSCTYSVIFNWTGFFSPVSNTGLNSVKAGQAVPLKFSLSGNQGLNIFAAGYPRSATIVVTGCAATATNDVETVTAGGSSLSYDATTDQYNYVWKTDKAWVNQCRTVTLKLIDGTEHSASFSFKK